MHNALIDHEDRRGDLVPGEWRRDRNLEDIRTVNIRGHKHSKQKREDCEKYSEALGQLSSGKCALQDRMVPKLEVEN